MAEYTVHLTTTISTSIKVEAADRDEAIEKAFDSDAMPRSLCAYCSGYGQPWSVDMAGDWEESGVTNPDGSYWDARNEADSDAGSEG